MRRFSILHYPISIIRLPIHPPTNAAERAANSVEAAVHADLRGFHGAAHFVADVTTESHAIDADTRAVVQAHEAVATNDGHGPIAPRQIAPAGGRDFHVLELAVVEHA